MRVAAQYNKAEEKTQKTLNTSHKTNFTENGELKIFISRLDAEEWGQNNGLEEIPHKKESKGLER